MPRPLLSLAGVPSALRGSSTRPLHTKARCCGAYMQMVHGVTHCTFIFRCHRCCMLLRRQGGLQLTHGVQMEQRQRSIDTAKVTPMLSAT